MEYEYDICNNCINLFYDVCVMGNNFSNAVTSTYAAGIRAVADLVYPASDPTATIAVPAVPGAAVPVTIDLPICAFTNTEANHDLHEAIPRATHKTEGFYRVIRRDIGQCNGVLPPAGPSPKDRFNFYDDEGIVKAIMGLTKSQVQNIPPNTSYALDILQHIPGADALTGSRINRVRIKVCTPVVGKEYNSDDLLGLFEGKDNVFFIIDVGDHFVEKLRKITSGDANRLNIHVVHSAITQADSASKTKPNARVYTDTDSTKPVRVFSWWYNQPIEINGDNARTFFLSQYNILTQPANVAAAGAAQPAAPAAGLGHSWKMSQTWKDLNDTVIYDTPDAHVFNSKPKVVTYLNTHLDDALKPGEPDKKKADKKKEDCSLDMQKKRSGDWLQIWMAYILCSYLSNRANFKGMNMIKKGTDPIRPANSNADIPVYTEQRYRQCTYFITGDWPAACYAIYRGVNVILVINGSTTKNIKPAIICINCN